MVNRKHVYVGHMFSDGVTILDATDPRKLKPVGFFTAGPGTRTHQLQTAEDTLLLANGANIVAMQSYDGMRGYFENNLVDSITNRKKFRSGLSIHDISKPGGDEGNRLSRDARPGHQPDLVAGRALRLPCAAHFDGYTDHILTIVDLKNITKPEIVSRWALPGMNRAAGETSDAAERQAGRAAPHDHRGESAATAHGAMAGSPSWTSAIRPNRSCCRTSTGRHRSPAARTRRCRCPAASSR